MNKTLSYLAVLVLLSGCSQGPDSSAGPTGPAIPTPIPDDPRLPHITGRVTLNGKPGSIDTSIFAQTHGCGESPIHKTENWKVGSNGQLADVVVWVTNPTTAISTPHPTTPVMNQALCRYEPHVVATTATLGVIYKNSDPVIHNVRARYSTGADAQPGDVIFNVGELPAITSMQTFPATGLFSIQCDVHSWMQGWVYVLPESCRGFWAVSATDGSFSIPSPGNGDFIIHAWHARFHDPVEMKVHTVNGAAVLDVVFDGTKSF